MAIDTEYVKVHITFDQDDPQYEGGFAGENLWATPVHESRGKDLYVVSNTPFFAYGVTLGDIVRAIDTGEGPLEVQEIVSNGGRGNVRAILMNGGLEELAKAATEAFPGAEIEGGFNAMLAASIAQTEVDALVAWLEADPSVNAVEVGKA